MPAPRADGCGNVFPLVWLLGWSSLVVVFDGLLAVALGQQIHALTFPTTDGVVTHSDVKASGGTYRLAIAYDYEVNGRRYTGTRYSYSEIGTNTRAWHRIAAELPVGARTPVAYDPNDPADSLLRPGFTGFHLFMIWFLTPFNTITVGGWWLYARHRRSEFDPTDPRTVKPIKGGYRVRLPGFGRVGCVAVVLLAITFCGSFVWAFGFGFDPPVAIAGPAYLVAVAIAALVGASLPLPKTWLEVDERARVVRFPPDPEPLEVPFATILDVVVRHEEEKDSEGNVQHEYHCDFVRSDEKPFYITTYRTPEPAEAFVVWLRERVGIAAAGAPPTKG